MKNLKRSAFGLSFLIALLCLASCTYKSDNRVSENYYQDSDFTVSCLYGFKYLTRVTSGSYIAPKFDINTGLPERCDK